MFGDYGSDSASDTYSHIHISGRYMTVRNNIIDDTGGQAAYLGIVVAREGVEWAPLGNKIYNNTFYSQGSHPTVYEAIKIFADADYTEVVNNLVAVPNCNETIIDDSGSNTIQSNNVQTNTPYLSDPSNSTPLSRVYTLTSNSTVAIDQGIALNIYNDYAGNKRTGTFEVGAYNYAVAGNSPNAPRGLKIK